MQFGFPRRTDAFNPADLLCVCAAAWCQAFARLTTVCQSDVFQSVSDAVATFFVCVSEVDSRENDLTSKENQVLPLSFSWRGGPRESECPVEQCHSLCTLL